MRYDPVLGSRFGFDAEDLRANDDGRLSDEQERMLSAAASAMARHEGRTRVLLVVVFGAAIAAVAVGIAVTPGGGPASALVAAAILAWILGLVAFFRARGRRTREAVEQRRLRTSEGTLAIRTDSTGTWWATVGGARFGVELLQAQAMTEGARYRVHHLDAPDGAVPLSLERVDDGTGTATLTP
jgi:membrane protein implicated in regulation of membrane protease activity